VVNSAAPSPVRSGADSLPVGAAGLAERHGPALYLLALTVTGSPVRSRTAVAAVIADACRRPDLADAVDEHEVRRELGRHTFYRCAAIADQVRFDPAVRPLQFEDFMAWLGTLSGYQRAAIALCVYGEHRAWQTAAVLNVSTATVHELLFWGLQDLVQWTRAAAPRGRRRARD
jgi:DNA-directed RNA polymerase specialized sigma24 family protein